MVINPLVAFLGGIVVGMAIILIGVRLSAIGTLRIDHTSSEKDLYLFDIEKDMSVLDHRSLAILKIDHDANLSQRCSQE